jgi:hypothetical protein
MAPHARQSAVTTLPWAISEAGSPVASTKPATMASSAGTTGTSESRVVRARSIVAPAPRNPITYGGTPRPAAVPTGGAVVSRLAQLVTMPSTSSASDAGVGMIPAMASVAVATPENRKKAMTTARSVGSASRRRQVVSVTTPTDASAATVPMIR